MTTKTFRDYNIQADLCDALADLDIIEPFPIQELTLPVALEGHDVIGHARTGSGKTLGFGLPLLNRLDRSRREVQALVVTPTRELCLQVTGDFEQAAKNTDIRIMPIYGGVPIEPQTQQLNDGVHVVVGTPGRLLDHVRRGNLKLSTCRIVVLDEADEMLDMGFLPDVEQLLAKCNDDRHTMLFSATMPTAVVNLARTYMDRPTFIRAEIEEHTIPELMEQHFFLVHKLDKPRILARILQTPERGLAVVFCRTKAMADRLVDDLRNYDIDAVAIHGDLRQATREKNLDKFRSETNRADVLVATEVAARGLDIDSLTHVVNYDPPEDEKMYLHRIGRTARAGEKGVAITFATFAEIDRLNATRKALDVAKEPIEEIFSTSDKLRELFDLPDETPWAHLSRTSKGSDKGSKSKSNGSSRSGSSKSDADSSSSKGGSDRGRRTKTDAGKGRSRSGSTKSESAAGGHTKGADATKPRRGDDSSPSRGKDTGRQVASADDASSGLTDEEPARTRTRTRSRGSSGGSSSSSRSSGGSSDRSSSRGSRGGDSSGDDTSKGRSRDGGDEAKKSSSGSGRVRARGGRKPGSSDSDSSGGGKQERSSAPRNADDAGGHQSSGPSERGGRSRSGGSNRGSDSAGSRSESRSGSRGSSRHDERTTNGNGRTPDGPTATTQGADARGEGQPGIVREVKVEHLP